MTKHKFAFSIAAFFSLCLLSSLNCFAQASKNQIEPSYEVVLQTLVASNSANNKTDVPQALSNVVKRLRTNYSYPSYRLTSTFLQRIANTGNIEFKTISSEAIPNQERNLSTFFDWSLSGLQSLPNVKGQNSIQFQSFRFGQRVPLINSIKDESGRTSSVVTYEQIGLTLQRFSLGENSPTVIGSLSTAKSDELMFLVLTVKPVEE
jgi:hypothetical protein